MSRARRPFPILLLLMVLTSACTSSSASPTATTSASPKPRVVALVTDVGGLHDRSYNQLADQGLREARKQDGVRYIALQSKTTNDYVANLTKMALRHPALIVAVGPSMGPAVYQAATAYPNQKFAIVDGAPLDTSNAIHNLNNVANLFFQEQEAGYLVGVIAGLMEKRRIGAATHGTIGYMGGLSIPQVDRYLAGYVAGARRVNPTVTIVGGYSNGFSDRAGGKSIGMQQIGRGADILFQVAAISGAGYLSAAQQQGRYGVGVDSDQSYLGKFMLTSAVKRVDVAVRDTVRSVVTGSFTGGDHRFGLKEDGVGFAPTAQVVPSSIVSQARMYARNIARGQIVPPTSIPRY